MLSVSSNTLNSMLEESLYVCGEMATDKDLYNYVNRLIEADKATFIRQKSVLFSHLQSIAFHSTDVSCVTIVNQDGVLIEAARYWSGGEQSALWEEEYSQTLESLYSGVMMELGNKTSGHYKVCAVPAMYEPTSKLQVFHVAVPIIGFSSSFERANAVMIVSFRMDSFAKASGLSEMNAQEYLCSYLTDASGNIIYHPDKQWLGCPVSAYQAGSSTVELEKQLSYFGWTAHISIDTGNLRSDVNRLYNQAIIYNVLEAGNFEVAEMLRNLSDILRYTFSKKGENVTLGQEFRWVEQYLSLQKFRLMDQFEYEIDFPEEYSEWPCCRLFISTGRQ